MHGKKYFGNTLVPLLGYYSSTFRIDWNVFSDIINWPFIYMLPQFSLMKLLVSMQYLEIGNGCRVVFRASQRDFIKKNFILYFVSIQMVLSTVIPFPFFKNSWGSEGLLKRHIYCLARFFECWKKLVVFVSFGHFKAFYHFLNKRNQKMVKWEKKI